jgi:hypothetical protein
VTLGSTALPSRQWHSVRDYGGSRGRIIIDTDYSNALQRQATFAELQHYQASTFPAGRLVDTYLEFMSESSFELGGLRVSEAYGEKPQRIERASWLCEVDLYEPELSKREARRLR